MGSTKQASVSSSLKWSFALGVAPICSQISFTFLGKCGLYLALSSYNDGKKGLRPKHIQALFYLLRAAKTAGTEETQSLHCVEVNMSETLLPNPPARAVKGAACFPCPPERVC